MAGLLSQVKELTTCKICLDSTDLLVLPCLHRMCAGCYDQICHNKAKSNIVECSFCRRKSQKRILPKCRLTDELKDIIRLCSEQTKLASTQTIVAATHCQETQTDSEDFLSVECSSTALAKLSEEHERQQQELNDAGILELKIISENLRQRISLSREGPADADELLTDFDVTDADSMANRHLTCYSSLVAADGDCIKRRNKTVTSHGLSILHNVLLDHSVFEEPSPSYIKQKVAAVFAQHEHQCNSG